MHAKVYWVFSDGHHPLVVTFVRRVLVKKPVTGGFLWRSGAIEF